MLDFSERLGQIKVHVFPSKFRNQNKDYKGKEVTKDYNSRDNRSNDNKATSATRTKAAMAATSPWTRPWARCFPGVISSILMLRKASFCPLYR
jgi:hypothetical protein